ncbi:MAG: SurA N-terminal domain-containing protein [Candidatus Omnitrophica bacterium]|nr:SurA N-terminal domain-containing protein [Candidatus Omnitrophota bacterium]MDD5352588.1 SurA N-terminal domain-containing protein [Candidatus Omnitrophota bacterium]MDD5550186.1 SurA N-terminal domain-containing protein [Candidatus Omnitrophota bacterium]
MKKIILLILMCVVLVNYAYCAEDKVIAIVNNEVITQAELNTYINLLKLQMGEERWKSREMSETKILGNLIEDRLVAQEAKNKKIEIEDRLIEARLKKMKKGFSTESEFSDFLMQQGLSVAELEQGIREQMMSDRLITQEIRRRIFISPKDVTDYYQNHIKDFYSPERLEVDSIFVEKQDLARDIYARLKGGADFGEMQRQYSQGSNLGVVEKGKLRKNIEDVIFSLEIGKFSKPLEVSEGYFIFLVRQKYPPAERKISEVQQEIYDKLLEMKFVEKLNAWIAQLKSKAYISIK